MCTVREYVETVGMYCMDMCRKQKQHLAARAPPFGAGCEILLGEGPETWSEHRKNVGVGVENWERIQALSVGKLET